MDFGNWYDDYTTMSGDCDENRHGDHLVFQWSLAIVGVQRHLSEDTTWTWLAGHTHPNTLLPHLDFESNFKISWCSRRTESRNATTNGRIYVKRERVGNKYAIRQIFVVVMTVTTIIQIEITTSIFTYSPNQPCWQFGQKWHSEINLLTFSVHLHVYSVDWKWCFSEIHRLRGAHVINVLDFKNCLPIFVFNVWVFDGYVLSSIN